MKKILLFTQILLALNIFAAPTKRALVIAIGAYPDFNTNHWGTIASVHDTTFVLQALRNQKFDDKNIALLLDGAATKDGIMKALENFKNSAGTGDICVIHISSHGVQLEDDDTDEEIDFKDECIVPYGAKYTEVADEVAKVAPGYLRDDDFGDVINQLRVKLGKDGDLLVTIDACHSGSATRSTEKCRGNKPAMLSKNAKANSIRGIEKETHSEFLERGANANSNLAGYTVISAAQAEQPNWEIKDDEGKAVGPLSYSIYQALANNTDTNLTYRGLFASIQAIMNVKANRQQPVMESEEKDRKVFGGKVIKQQAYFEISKSEKPGVAIVKAGAIQGLYAGSKVAFYKPGEVPGNGTKVDSGVVRKANNFYSYVELSNAATKFTERQYWAYMTEQNYGDGTIKVFVYDSNKKLNEIKKQLNKGIVEITLIKDSAAISLDTFNGKWALFIGTSDDTFQTNITLKDTNDMNKVRASIEDYNRYLFLQRLENKLEDYRVEIEIIPLNGNGIADTNLQKQKYATGIPEFEDGDEVIFKLTNPGDLAVYVSVLDLQPNGIINSLVPDINKGITPEDLRVPPHSSITLSKAQITIGEPFGKEILKVFAAIEKMPGLEALATTRDATPKGGGMFNSSFERFFQNVNKGTRGCKLSIDPDGTVFSYPFMIVSKKLVAEKH